MQEAKNTENITPISFSSMLWIFFDAVLRFLKHTIRFLYKNLFVLFIFLLAGFISGVIVYNVVRPTYVLSMLVKHTEFDPRIFNRMLHELNDLAESHSSEELSRTLQLSPNISREVVSFSSRNVEKTDDASEPDNRTLVIDVQVKNRNITDSLQKALLHYFNSNPYLNKVKRDKIQLNKNRLAFINAELLKLDTLKREYNKFLSGSKSNSMFYNNAFNPVELYKQSDVFHQQKNTLEEWLMRDREIMVSIDTVQPAPIPVSMGATNYILLYGGIFFLLGLLFIAARAVIRSTV